MQRQKNERQVLSALAGLVLRRQRRGDCELHYLLPLVIRRTQACHSFVEGLSGGVSAVIVKEG
jgi:hypothetical protein